MSQHWPLLSCTPTFYSPTCSQANAEPSQRSGLTLWLTSNNRRLTFRSLKTKANKERTNQLPPSALENERGKNQPTGKGWAWSDHCESSNLCCTIRLLTPRTGPALPAVTFPRPQGLMAPPHPVIYFTQSHTAKSLPTSCSRNSRSIIQTRIFLRDRCHTDSVKDPSAK